jgi:uncharacterized protein YjbI with pentapeptide repeats
MMVRQNRTWKDARLAALVEQYAQPCEVGTESSYNFENACMPNANFSELSLHHAFFMNVAAEKARFDKAELDWARFSHSHLVGASFRDARLAKAQFHNTNLVCADFTEASLQGADFRHADLSSANFYKAHIASARLTYTKMDGVKNLLCIYPLAKQQSCLYAVNHGSYGENIKVYQEGCFWGSLEEYAELVKNNCEAAMNSGNIRHNRALKNAIKYIRQYGKLYW